MKANPINLPSLETNGLTTSLRNEKLPWCASDLTTTQSRTNREKHATGVHIGAHLADFSKFNPTKRGAVDIADNSQMAYEGEGEVELAVLNAEAKEIEVTLKEVLYSPSLATRLFSEEYSSAGTGANALKGSLLGRVELKINLLTMCLVYFAIIWVPANGMGVILVNRQSSIPH